MRFVVEVLSKTLAGAVVALLVFASSIAVWMVVKAFMGLFA